MSSTAPTPGPVLSLVSAVYNVAAYLPAFLAGIDAQTGPLGAVEFVFVDDGSPDESAAIIERWRDAHPHLDVRLVRKENGGAASARNAGLEVARGDWVSFPDPDDVLAPEYLRTVLDFVATPDAEDVALLAANFVFLNDEDGSISDTHLLRNRFAYGTRIADLAGEPQIVVVAGNHSFYRRRVLVDRDLRQDERIRPVWEDGHLTARYLGTFARPRVALLADARYLYRRRSDGSSLMQGAWASPAKFSVVPRDGWLDALRTVTAERGVTPPWLQFMVLYDLIGYLQRERQSPSPTAWVPPELGGEFLDTAAAVLAHIESASIESFAVNPVTREIRRALTIGLKGEGGRPARATSERLDPARRLVRVQYHFAGPRPDEQFLVDGRPVRPRLAKWRPAVFYGRTLMTERIAWLPAGAKLELSLDGRPVPIVAADPEPGGRLRGALDLVRRSAHDHGWRLAARGLALRLAAHNPWSRRRFARAWLLIDRDTDANDNAEHLYRYLRAHRPEVNAWFVLRRESKDWDRLARDGFRLIPFRSPQAYLALQHAEHLVSSHLDRYITEMLPHVVAPPRWKYTFLQHGVTKDDQSLWFNTKPIELLVTSTRDEHDAIVSDESNYVFTDRETRLVGMPRFDRLRELAAASEGEPRRTLLVMPTWRRELLQQAAPHVRARGNDRDLLTGFWTSDYALQWRAVLESERLHKVADAHGWQIEFVPHPNMQRYLDDSPLPAHVRARRFTDVDIQQLFARAGVLVTDYSSVAFDVAYLERPVVYFQFDEDAFFTGGHIFKRGAWSYREQGFGPVTTDAAAAVDAIVGIIEREGRPEPEYAERIAATFELRDGRCCERTYLAIRDLDRPMDRADVVR